MPAKRPRPSGKKSTAPVVMANTPAVADVLLPEVDSNSGPSSNTTESTKTSSQTSTFPVNGIGFFSWDDGTKIEIDMKWAFSGTSMSAVSMIAARVLRIRSHFEDIASTPAANMDDPSCESYVSTQLDGICIMFEEIKAELHRICPASNNLLDTIMSPNSTKLARILEEKMAYCAQLRASLRRREMSDEPEPSPAPPGQAAGAQRERRKLLLRDDLIRRLHRRLAATERDAEWERMQRHRQEKPGSLRRFGGETEEGVPTETARLYGTRAYPMWTPTEQIRKLRKDRGLHPELESGSDPELESGSDPELDAGPEGLSCALTAERTRRR